MKTICVLSYERTGSTWLCTALNTNQTWCVFEIFSRNPALYYWNLLSLLKSKDNIPQSVVESFAKIFSPKNLFIDAKSFAKIKQNMLAQQPFSIDLLKDFQKEAYSQNRNFCFKLFPQHLDSSIKIDDILSLSDSIIINYRSNILETFLSWKIAIKTGAWTSRDKKDPSVQDNKVWWDRKEYDTFYGRIISHIDLWLSITQDRGRLILRYEDIHSHPTHIEKIQYLQDRLKEINLSNIELNYKDEFQKQIDYLGLNDLIENYSDFTNDLNLGLNTHYLPAGV